MQASDRVTQAQLAFTIQAYTDGVITPEEAAQTEVFSKRIQQITLDLAECLRTGVVPPGYPPAHGPDTKPPVANTFGVGIARWHIGDRAFAISWHTSEPTRVSICFRRISTGETGPVAPRLHCREPQNRQNASRQKPRRHLTPVGSLHAPLGATSVTFKGKVGGHRLKPGSYLLTLVATDRAGNHSKPKTAHLKILTAKHKH